MSTNVRFHLSYGTDVDLKSRFQEYKRLDFSIMLGIFGAHNKTILNTLHFVTTRDLSIIKHGVKLLPDHSSCDKIYYYMIYK